MSSHLTKSSTSYAACIFWLDWHWRRSTRSWTCCTGSTSNCNKSLKQGKSGFVLKILPLWCSHLLYSAQQPPSRSGCERRPSDRVVAQSKCYYIVSIYKIFIKLLSQFKKKKKQLLERKSKPVNALNVNGRGHNNYGILLVIYQMRLKVKGRNNMLDRYISYLFFYSAILIQSHPSLHCTWFPQNPQI